MSPSSPSVQTAAERRAAEAELRASVARFAPAHIRLVEAMRRAVRKRLPAAHEIVYDYRDWCVISYAPSERGYEGVLAIRASSDGVKLYFHGGKELADPTKLLQGAGQARWIEVESAAALARPAVASLIDATVARRREAFAPAGRGPILIRSTSAKKRRRQRPA